MAISPYKEQRLILLARFNLGLASDDLEEIDIYNNYQRNINEEKDRKQQK